MTLGTLVTLKPPVMTSLRPHRRDGQRARPESGREIYMLVESGRVRGLRAFLGFTGAGRNWVRGTPP